MINLLILYLNASLCAHNKIPTTLPFGQFRDLNSDQLISKAKLLLQYSGLKFVLIADVTAVVDALMTHDTTHEFFSTIAKANLTQVCELSNLWNNLLLRIHNVICAKHRPSSYKQRLCPGITEADLIEWARYKFVFGGYCNIGTFVEDSSGTSMHEVFCCVELIKKADFQEINKTQRTTYYNG